jgi:hypothetical protein
LYIAISVTYARTAAFSRRDTASPNLQWYSAQYSYSGIILTK